MNHHLQIKGEQPDISTWDKNDDPLSKWKWKWKRKLDSLNRGVNIWYCQVAPDKQSKMNSERNDGRIK